MKRRTLLAAGGSAVAIAGATWAIFSSKETVEQVTATSESQQPESLTSGPSEMVLGNPDAAVEVIEYASFTCPHCASFHENQFKALQANYIETGKIRFVYREVYFDRPGLWASMIARCAGTEEFFFAFAELLYAEQRAWLASGDPAGIIADLRRLAKTAGMDDAALDACLSDAAKAEALFNWYQENAERDGINSTPSFLIDGEKYSNMAYDDFAAILDEKLG